MEPPTPGIRPWILIALSAAIVLPASGGMSARDAADLARAAALAELGVQDAEARLKGHFPFRAFDGPGSIRPYKFWGADKTETVEPPLAAKVEEAANPSYAVELDADPATLWFRGRYTHLQGEVGSVGTFTSQAISLPPSGPGAPVKILGAAWTWLGEGADAMTGARTLYDQNGFPSVAPSDVGPRVQLSVRDGAMVYGPYDDDGFSAVLSVSGVTPVIADPTQAKYVAQFRFDSASFATILLATPVLDDVTLYWNDGAASARVDVEPPVAITGPASIPDATAGVPFSQAFTASGGPVVWSAGGTLPPGLALDPVTGVLSGTPGGAGTYTFTVTAIHAGRSSGSQYTMVVLPGAAGGGGGGGGGGSGGCGLLGVEAALWLLLRRRRRGARAQAGGIVHTL